MALLSKGKIDFLDYESDPDDDHEEVVMLCLSNKFEAKPNVLNHININKNNNNSNIIINNNNNNNINNSSSSSISSSSSSSSSNSISSSTSIKSAISSSNKYSPSMRRRIKRCDWPAMINATTFCASMIS